MRIEGTGTTEHIGSVKVYGVRRMLELDSGLATITTARGKPETQKISLEDIRNVEQREYSETLVLGGDIQQNAHILNAIKQTGLDYVFGGKFFEVASGNDKGKAVKILNELYELNYGEVFAVSIGDSENDQSLPLAVDDPYLVLGSDGRWTGLKIPGLNKINAIRPEGWSQAVHKLLQLDQISASIYSTGV
ncbi:MAG: hypothetical protein WC231_07555 [Dehalococcoidales bacterium]|jgi:mannosyl-3-phosphoglycerate synthase|nr:hypothetical protein [Dehalococcoidales bacterium]MDD5605149.1 hypothetical protein [Dehalococcoidales bacterium]MDX9986083.1 hypothetical protein [Dehalococcoidales bacterium]NLE89332.1 hypothetical protein [Dehalococcoidales bacterium]